MPLYLLAIICLFSTPGCSGSNDSKDVDAAASKQDTSTIDLGSATDPTSDTGLSKESSNATEIEQNTGGDTNSSSDGDTDTDTDTDTDSDLDADTDTDSDGDTDSYNDSSQDIETSEDTETTGTDTFDTKETDTPTWVDTDGVPATTISIDAATRHQTMQGFGASDAWNVDWVGKYWSEDEKQAIAALLFQTALDEDGNPNGIGLSRWRFNLGAGSMEQGESSGIEDPTRRAECFLTANDTYDWNKQAGQQWFLNAASEYGVDRFVLFSNSPPVHQTRNGLAWGPDSISANLPTDQYDDFADFMATVLAHFEAEGIPFKEVSPVNEPQHAWNDGGQEGSTWLNSEISQLVRELDTSLTSNGLDTHIVVSDAADWNQLHENAGNAEKSDQMWNFFDPERSDYIGDLPHVPAIISGHTYWTYPNDSTIESVRQNINEEAQWFNLEVQQTEYSLLSETETPDEYMANALFLAKIVYADIAIANVVSWSFWTALDRERWDHNNRFSLIRLMPPGGDYGALDEGGTHEPHKTLWTLGNYSLFIRPGFTRIHLSDADDLSGLMGTAYIAPDDSEIISVFVNWYHTEQKIKVTYNALPDGKSISSIEIYVTDAENDLHKAAALVEGQPAYLPPRSVVTFRTRL